LLKKSSTLFLSFLQIIFEVVTSGQHGYLAIDEVKVLRHPCTKIPHFLRLRNVEVNAGQIAAFDCGATGKIIASDSLILQGLQGQNVPVKETNAINNRKFKAIFNIANTTRRDAGDYRCIIHSEGGVGVSNYAVLVVKGNSGHMILYTFSIIICKKNY
uniref:Ig-like domain-containing protein n=1 Tax=Latimeria chalumnae TaxID=7897 RepID=H3AIF0_LATCH